MNEASRPERHKNRDSEVPARDGSGHILRDPDVNTPGPLSFEQEEIWLHQQLAPDIPLYNEVVTIYRYGPLDVAAFKRSFQEMIRRHAMWRTTFKLTERGVEQVIQNDLLHKMQICDLSHLAPADRQSEFLRIRAEKAKVLFDLINGPLLRAILMKVSDDDYRLCLVLHHIIFDAVSIAHVFLPELISTYEANVEGRMAALPDLPLRYTDYAVWQRSWLEQAEAKRQANYWRNQLSGDLPDLNLPSDRPRPNRQTFRGAMYRFVLPKSLSNALKAFSERECVTLFISLLTAFAALLHRYSGQNEFLLGVPISHRNDHELERVVGFFLNTVALRASLSDTDSVRQFLRKMRNVTLDAISCSDFPLHRLPGYFVSSDLRNLAPPLRVLFSMEPAAPEYPAGWHFTQMDVDTHTSKFDLQLSMEEQADSVAGRFVYNADLFDAETIARLGTHFQKMLAGIAADPDQLVSRLPLLTAEERQQIVVEWNNTEKEFPRDKCVHQLFEKQVELTPNNVAIVMGNEQLTYNEVNLAANGIARRLVVHGIRPRSRVGISTERSLEMVAGLLAILKVGAAYVPLDPGYPPERLSFVAQDAGLQFLICSPRSRASFPHCCALPFNLQEAISRHEGNLDIQVSSRDLAYITYTSGSTGRPKGVEIPHRAIIRLLVGADYVTLGPNEKILQLAPLTFDASTFEIWGALLHGGQCVLFEEAVPSLQVLHRVLHERQITTLWLTASLFNAIVDDMPTALSGIHQLLIGGESLSVPHVRRAVESIPNTTIINCYGPTESTTFASAYRIPPQPELLKGSVPIGRPIANTRIYLLDRHGEPVPLGAPGEIYIGGDGVALGYLNRPDLTKEKFVPDCFGGARDARLYRTGDLGRYLKDGNLEFLGRTDFQVKIGGFRIEPGEIEQAIASYPGVRGAVVVARQVSPGSKCLVAYVAGGGGKQFTSLDLREFLSQKLPNYMIPAHYLIMDSLPFKSNGKIDRQALPPVPANVKADSFIPPSNLAEQQLLEIWRELLGARSISVHDSFFELGGRSLAAARLLLRVEKVFGKCLSMANLMEAPSIRELAILLRDAPAKVPGLVRSDKSVAGTPFICIGGDSVFSELAEMIANDHPFWALEIGELDRNRIQVPYRMEDIAKVAIQTIVEHFPTGTLLLGGWCLTGLLAYEVGRQLQMRGRDVALIALFDTPNPAFYRSSKWERCAKMWLSRIRFHLTHILRSGFHDSWDYGVERVKELLMKVRRLAWGLRLSTPNEQASDLSYIVYLASLTYQPQPYSGAVTLFQATDRPQGQEWDLANGWYKLVPHLNAVEIPGNHRTMFHQPNAHMLSTALR